MASDPELFTPGTIRPGQLSEANSYLGIQARTADLANPAYANGVSAYSHRLFGLGRPGSHDGRTDESNNATQDKETEHQPRENSISPTPTIRNESQNREKTSHKNESKQEKSKQHEGESDSDTVNQKKDDQQPRGSHEDLEAGKEEKDSKEDEGEEKDPNIVDWDGEHDKGNPLNWPFWKKCVATASLSLTTLAITFASSIFSTATMVTAQEFDVSEEVMILGVSLFVLGFAFGPMIWGPLSELYGRKLPLFTGYICFAVFQIPVALATNLHTIMICRFFGGLFGSSALAVIGGTLADFWDPVDRGVAICFFAGATFLGPVFGPILGSFITESYLGWRWTAWITLIMASFFGSISLFAVPESYAPVLLQKRAKELRLKTGNWALHAKADEQETNFKDIVEQYLGRPLVMAVKEPILVLITVYMALIYGILYLFFEAYPIAFQENRGWSPGLGSLPFLSIIIGVVIGGSIITYLTLTRFRRKLEESGGKPVPEERLPAMIIGGVFFPIGLFWFAWTSNPAINWVPQVLAGIPIGAGVLMIFMQGLNYLIDVYMMHANSAIAANTLLRSLAGAGFPMFATPMFHNLGVNWAGTLLGCLAVACFPFPILFYIYGGKIRKMSKYSPTD